ncbi:hypothetical protein [Streptomyces sp. AC627_RSS907]|uniref:hypothetical protein n=1 Tax=Streptomyces sp. AC627_RSS907 TaxID=2823684 RepID=UPI001C2291B7|nr:hypothetical protein [Streptomyces sp. AC627_RSS907]
MTTTGSTDERPEPQPDGADGADDARAEPAAPAGQDGDSDGSPPAVPAQPSRQSDADEGNGPRESFASIVAETLGLAPGASRRRRAVTLLVMVSLAFVAVFRDTLIDYVMIETSVARENDSNAEYDANKVPFTVSVRPEEDEPETWAMVLDRALTPDEQWKAVAGGNRSATFSYLKELGGHPLADEATLEYAPERYKKQLASGAIGRYADVFQMNVMSTRSTSVVINDWKVTDVTCRKSTGHTVVMLPEQGGAAYEGLQLHIPPLAGEPVLTDETEGQGEPYFSTRYLEVGGGQPSGGFKVHAIAPPGQSCEWGIKVRYTDSYQETRWVQLKDGKGKPLRLHTDSVPVDPRRTWVLIVQPWRLCDQKDLSKCVT